MRTCRRIVFLLLIGALAAPAGVGKVYVRWTLSSVPSAKTLGVSDLVIPWGKDAQGLAGAATKQGFHLYLEATVQQAPTAAETAAKEKFAGVILRGSATEESQLIEMDRKLSATYPKLKILMLSAGGKQPEMRGWLVFKRDGILQVSSPTSQPWLDANLAMIRQERAFQTTQAPLYTFSWDLSDPLVKEQGPNPADYALAVAEAGAFHADLLLELHEQQQKGLATGDKDTLMDWERVKRTIEFSERGNHNTPEVPATVAVLTNDYDSSYEAINLMARHNIPYRVLHLAEVKPQDLQGFDVVIAFAALGNELSEAIRAFAEKGGVAVLVNLPGPYPWDSSTATTKGAALSYAVGKGRVIELGESVSDPETFAQDIRRLMLNQRIPTSLWNSLTTLVAAYPGEKSGETIVELVNYDEEAAQVQVRVKGTFGSARYESPERGCCEKLKLGQVDGFTEFVVPDFMIGGRVLLQQVGRAK